jgi:peptide/nickel transport system permease protein
LTRWGISMHTYILRRGITAILTVLIVTTVVFIILRLIPGDPAQLILGLEAPQERVQEIRKLLGLDRPIYLQYLVWLKDLCLGNLGKSLRSNETVLSLLFQRIHVTFWIACFALIISITIALPLGVFSALHPWSWIDFFSLFTAQIGLAIPSFWLGILLILLFSVKLQWLPLIGYVNFSENPVEWFRHLLLPSFALGFIRVAILTRMIRVSMLEELGKDYVTVARAKGLAERIVILHHTLRNALLPVITVTGMQFGYLLGGAIIIEQVFGLPGIGRLLLNAISNRDFPVIQGTVVFIAIVFTGLNLVIDILYGLLNPKISVQA